MPLNKKRYFRVEADIDLDAIYHNIEQVQKSINSNKKVMIVIKADGYGHGAIPIAKKVDSIVDGYGVAIIEEGIELRKAGINRNILIFGYTSPQQFEELIKYNITPSIFQYSMALELSKEAVRQNKTVPIHIKIDTGMSRLGFFNNEKDIKEIIKISKLDGIRIEGIFTHFACADETDKSITYKQLDDFLQMINSLEKEGVTIPIKHVSNSAGIIDLPEANLDLVRCGIASYGLFPSNEVNRSNIDLLPALSLKSHVSFVKEVDTGTGVSYGRTYITSRKTKIATIPIGYGDGYPRNLSSKGRVLIHGKSAPILGRICMDQFMVDVTDINDVKQGDIVTLIGQDETECITVDELAQLSATFNYEFICNIGKRIPRLYYSNKELTEIIEYK